MSQLMLGYGGGGRDARELYDREPLCDRSMNEAREEDRYVVELMRAELAAAGDMHGASILRALGGRLTATACEYERGRVLIVAAAEILGGFVVSDSAYGNPSLRIALGGGLPHLRASVIGGGMMRVTSPVARDCVFSIESTPQEVANMIKRAGETTKRLEGLTV